MSICKLPQILLKICKIWIEPCTAYAQFEFLSHPPLAPSYTLMPAFEIGSKGPWYLTKIMHGEDSCGVRSNAPDWSQEPFISLCGPLFFSTSSKFPEGSSAIFPLFSFIKLNELAYRCSWGSRRSGWNSFPASLPPNKGKYFMETSTMKTQVTMVHGKCI